LKLWRELQREEGSKLVELTGSLMIGDREGRLVGGTVRSAKTYNLPYKLLDGNQFHDRFSVFRIPGNHVAVYEPSAGILFAEECVKAHVRLAQNFGCEFHFEEPLLRWNAEGGGVVVTTRNGRYSANKLVFAAGSWLPTLLTDLRLPLVAERQIVFWFEPKGQKELYTPAKLPVFAHELDDRSIFYGIPDLGNGLKVARHHGGEPVSPDAMNRTVTEEDEAPVRAFLAKHLPSANGPVLDSTTCIYTNTPDSYFLVDFHPNHENVLLVSACSGHGFKFSSVIGEVAAELLDRAATQIDISRFNLGRFEQSPANKW
jgi:sarcosine oxidase